MMRVNFDEGNDEDHITVNAEASYNLPPGKSTLSFYWIECSADALSFDMELL